MPVDSVWGAEASRGLRGVHTSRRIRTALVLALCLSLAACTVPGSEKETISAVVPGGMAPNFTAKDLSGNSVSLSGLSGRIVVLEFWATWCPPCRSSVPELIALQDKYRDRNVTVLAVSVDEGRNLSAKVQDFTKENKINYTVLLGTEAITRAYKVKNIPVLFVIDKTGKIAGQHVGALDDVPGALDSQIEKLL